MQSKMLVPWLPAKPLAIGTWLAVEVPSMNQRFTESSKAVCKDYRTKWGLLLNKRVFGATPVSKFTVFLPLLATQTRGLLTGTW
jgi:hypothetical protein